MTSVMIVDDHPAIRMAVKASLELTGQFKVVAEAATGPAAIGAMREHHPALLILDLDLPGMSGLDLIERVRSANPATKLLVLSAQQESIFATRALQAGADGFLSKTEDMKKLTHAAQSVMAGYSVFPTTALMSLTSPATDGADSQLRSLSDRELMVLQHLARGMSNKEIADMLHISNKTVSSFKARIYEKLGISTIVELVDFARAHQLIT